MSSKTHGETDTRLYRIWRGIHARCENPKRWAYKYYGARGVTVCKEWHRYEAFRNWALANGYADDLTIDRIDNRRGYSPDNCRWSTRLTQSRNRSSFLVELTIFGETKIISMWAQDPRCQVNEHCFRRRLQHGWEVERALTTPIRPTGKHLTPEQKREIAELAARRVFNHEIAQIVGVPKHAVVHFLKMYRPGQVIEPARVG